MAHDLRELFEKERSQKQFQMKKGHEDRFLDLLEKELPVEDKRSFNFWWVGIAASVTILVSVGVYFITQHGKQIEMPTQVVSTTNADMPKQNQIGLGDLSPDLQKLETYYVANINLALSKVEISDDNKEIVDGYLEQLEELNQEYIALNSELNEIGPNDQTIAAMVQNLQLRAQLLQKLNEKLNQLKTSKNEQSNHII